MPLTDDQIDQYSRQIILPELGGVGQKALLAARCLLIGDGPAIETAATYLAGAGVGTLHRTGDRNATMRYAPLEDRNRDVRIERAPERPEPAGYQVLLTATTPTRVATGRAHLGEIALASDASGVHVSVIPSGEGCADCRGRATSPASRRDAIDEAAAGAMAALTALLWIAGISPDLDAKRLTLTGGAPAWTESPLGPTPACSRPCRP